MKPPGIWVRLRHRVRQFAKWLVPGIRVKRFLALVLLGVLLVTAGSLLLLLGYLHLRGDTLERIVALPGGATLGLGALLVVLGLYGIFLGVRATIRSVAGIFLPRGDHRLVELLVQRRALPRGPRIVAIGGGTGLSTLLRGLKAYATHLTAVVTVTDDGGSSGRLRRELGILPPGDINDCLVALAEVEPVMTRLFQHRFDRGDLAGHSFGNLFLASMVGVGGDLVSAVRLASRVLAIRGQVLPATADQAVLGAEFADGTVVEGESAIPQVRKAIRRVYLNPPNVRPVPEVLEALAEADLILLGPGSLFTSVLPNLLVPGIAEALRKVSAPVVYIVNVMTQPGETDGFRASDHVRMVVEHLGPGVVDVALVNTQMPRNRALLERYREQGAFPVEPDLERIRQLGVEVVGRPLMSELDLLRHDPARLAQAVLEILERLLHRRRPLRVSVINP
ncbi:MAG: YvcK family protein [Armatimonadota bacterium]|nr:YvcK family protein [Armatimonadota bacterium]MDR7562513.1 YvcK family protein [Armatimonadota bacterium]MDR7566788.1 YvcK family protein [Armatimonadota bacterium]MDR7601397.1 YvcK family protein [Armatimonadota bacterium]